MKQVRGRSAGRTRDRLAALSLCVALAGGCSQQVRPIFEEQYPPIVWPSPPKPARIRYVGQLSSSADLKPPARPFQALGDLLAGAKPAATMRGPRAVVCTRDGARVWVADAGGHCLHLFDLQNRSYKTIERAGPSRLLSPVGLALGPDDSIYVCDSEGVAIHRLSDRTGLLIESLRLPQEVRRPVAVSYERGSQELFVVDVSAHDIKVLGLDGSLRRIVGRRGAGEGELNFPCAIAGDAELLWVVDAGNHRVQGLTRAGEPVAVFGQAGDGAGDLALPKGIALDSAGHVYVVDARFENVQVFDRTGRVLLAFGEEGIGPGQFWLPSGIFIGANDRIWICDTYNRRVQVFEFIEVPGRSQADAAP